MSPEHRALLLLLGVGVAGHVVRLFVAPTQPPGQVRLTGSASASAALARRDSLARLARPLAPGERIDVDRATAQEIDRLPGVGSALAQRIVEERRKHGPFGDTSALRRVPGIGPSKLARMAPNLTFSASPGTPPANVAAPRQASTAPVTDQVINRGSADDLEKVSGIGKRRAARIVAFRDSAGPISSAAQLAQVLGISLALAEALWKAARQ